MVWEKRICHQNQHEGKKIWIKLNKKGATTKIQETKITQQEVWLQQLYQLRPIQEVNADVNIY